MTCRTRWFWFYTVESGSVVFYTAEPEPSGSFNTNLLISLYKQRNEHIGIERQWMGHMWRRDGWTKRAKYAKKTQRERQDKWTSLEDMFMYHVLRNPNQATSLPDSSLDEEHIPNAIHEIV
ncbi:uncharacterized protein G2W53_033429 [Senna tora]|uniref:Uncharacterized protein n=1 Tax=Senna tora TaxID=362788 RepID=A0A834SXH8_9FABA|nr:uncharacterized protein G2W53_033429 [Senna tora]